MNLSRLLDGLLRSAGAATAQVMARVSSPPSTNCRG